MHKKNLIRDDDKDDKYKIKQQNNKMDTKPPNVFNYLKSLSQKAKYLMDEIDDADDDIDDGKLLFIGSNKEKFNFNTFNKLYFSYYNGKTSLKEAGFSQENLEKQIEELKFNYKPKNEKKRRNISSIDASK